MVSPVASVSYATLNICNVGRRTWSCSGGSNLPRSFPNLSVSSLDDENAARNRRVACACVAPPQDFTPAKFIVKKPDSIIFLSFSIPLF